MNNPLTFNSKVVKLETQQRKHRNYQNIKPSYEAMNWKNYTMTRPRNISVQDADRLSAKNSVRQRNSPSYYYEPQAFYQPDKSKISQRQMRDQNLRLSGVTYNKRQQHMNRMKQDTIRRVKMLQQKVMPLISNDKNGNELKNQEYGFAWQLKMQQKLVKIQNSVQNIKNQVQIRFEKRALQIQKHWQNRINQLLMLMESNNTYNTQPQENRTNGEMQKEYNQQQYHSNGKY